MCPQIKTIRVTQENNSDSTSNNIYQIVNFFLFYNKQLSEQIVSSPNFVTEKYPINLNLPIKYKTTFSQLSYILPLYRFINLAHNSQSTHQHYQTYTHPEVGISRCQNIVQLQSWECRGSVNNPQF